MATTNSIDSLLSNVNLPGATIPSPPSAMTIPVRGVTVDEAGRKRSEEDLAAARANGWAPAETIYTRGTMVVQAGVDNARRSRVDWDKQPLAEELCELGIARVRAEERRDVAIPAHSWRMNKAGDVQFPVGSAGEMRTIEVEERAFGQLLSRSGIPSGSGYLRECWPELRAMNCNRWQQKLGDDEKAIVQAALLSGKGDASPEQVVLRTRKGEEGRKVFSAVSTTYAAYDVDKILEAAQMAFRGTGARGRFDYDGTRAKLEVNFHSDVQPEAFVCGEFFKGGVTIKTADDGSGAIRMHTSLWQNLCLNLIIIDQATTGLLTIRHVGTVRQIAEKFRKAFDTAQLRLEHFTKRWGFARQQDVVRQAIEREQSVRDLDVDVVFPGLFRGLLESEVLAVKGDRETVVDALMDCWRADQSSATSGVRTSRAAVANAVTRYAHRVNQSPDVEEQLEVAAGQIVWSDKPLPYAAPKS